MGTEMHSNGSFEGIYRVAPNVLIREKGAMPMWRFLEDFLHLNLRIIPMMPGLPIM